MWSNAGMANKQGDVDLRFAQVDVSQLTLHFASQFLLFRHECRAVVKTGVIQVPQDTGKSSTLKANVSSSLKMDLAPRT